MKLKAGWLVLALLLCIPIIVSMYHHVKPLPKQISYEGNVHRANVQFLQDSTYMHNGERVMKQTLLTEMLAMIKEAEELLVIDMFLFNDDYDRAKGSYPAVAQTVTDALLAKRAEHPTLPITVITDAVNTLYGANTSSFLTALEEADIQVIMTNMKPLRDSNPLYSAVYRAYLQWWPTSQNGFLPNAFNPDGGNGSVGAYFSLVNFKANHRKVVLNEQRALITSANLTHDGSSAHSNIGFVLTGGILADIYASEQAVAALSNDTLPPFTFDEAPLAEGIDAQLITEGKIKAALLETLQQADEDARIQIGIFYLADRQIVRALKDAAARGATVQLIADPNKDAFGLEKNGIPNRQVAAELMKERNIEVRWYDTHGEQFHSKFLLMEQRDTMHAIAGSANFTRRNLADYNLETNVRLMMPSSNTLAQELRTYFDTMWTNEGGTYTAPFEAYEDRALWKKLVYRLQEWTGLSTF